MWRKTHTCLFLDVCIVQHYGVGDVRVHVVDQNLGALVYLASAAFAARGPRAVGETSSGEDGGGGAVGGFFVEVHFDGRVRWLDDERHQEEEAECAENAEQQEEGGRVEDELFL